MKGESYSTVDIGEQQKQKQLDEHTEHSLNKDLEQPILRSKISRYFVVLLFFLIMITVVYYFSKQKYKWVQFRQVFNRHYLGQQLSKFNSTTLSLDLKDDADVESYMYKFEDGSQILSKSFIKRQNQLISDEELQKQLLDRIAYEIIIFSDDKQLNFAETENLDLSISNRSIKNNSTYEISNNNINVVQRHKDKEIPICIFSQGKAQVQKQDLERYFNSLQNQNYSNFHIVYVNEFSGFFQPKTAYNFLNQSNLNIKKKVKIINNLQYMGTLANMYFWIRKFCGEEDIVFIVGKDEQIINKQSLKILQSTYNCDNIWFSYSKFIQKSQQPTDKIVVKQHSIQIKQPNSFRHLRSFRNKLLNSISITSLIDYKIDKQSHQAWPTFYHSNLRQFQDWMQFENIAKYREGELNETLLQIPPYKNQLCPEERKIFRKSNLYLRTPVSPINKLGQKAKQIKKTKINKLNIDQIRNSYENLQNCKEQKFKKRFHKRTIFNKNYINTIFGKSDKVMINLTHYMSDTKDVWNSFKSYETVSIEDPTFILTPTDLNKLIQQIDFQKYREQLQSKIPYEILQFQQDLKTETPIPLLQFKYFKKDQEIEQYLKNLINISNNNTLKLNESNFQLSAQLFFNPTKQQVLQAQLYYFNKRYNISQTNNQVPICVFTAQRNIFKKKQYIQYFDSMQRLNYSNYHIIYIDDYSSDDSAYELYDLVNSGKYPRIKNRMTIIHNLHAVGGLGNMYFWTQKFCNQNQIFVNMDADDAALGAQSFKVLSKAYEDQNIWYVQSRHLWYQEKKFARFGFVTRELKDIPMKTSDYRRSRIFISSHIRSFRIKLWKAVPIYQLLQFHYNSTTKIAWPTFNSLAFDTTHVYAQFQLAGDDRIKYLYDFLYAYYGPSGGRQCFFIHQYFDHMKGTLKTPLQQINSLDQKGRQIKNDIIEEEFYKFPTELNQKMLKLRCFQP